MEIRKKSEICAGTLGNVEKCAFLSGISGTTQHRSAFLEESSQIKFRTTTRNDLAPNFRVLENPKPAKKIMNDGFEHHFGFGLVEIMDFGLPSAFGSHFESVSPGSWLEVLSKVMAQVKCDTFAEKSVGGDILVKIGAFLSEKMTKVLSGSAVFPEKCARKFRTLVNFELARKFGGLEHPTQAQKIENVGEKDPIGPGLDIMGSRDAFLGTKVVDAPSRHVFLTGKDEIKFRPNTSDAKDQKFMGLGNPMKAKKIMNWGKKYPFGLGLNLVEKRVPKRACEWLDGTPLEEKPAKKSAKHLVMTQDTLLSAAGRNVVVGSWYPPVKPI